MDELWKDIEEFESLYQISNHGRVKSLPRFASNSSRKIHGRILKQSYCGNYKVVGLSKNGKIYSMYVHRLVAIAFVPNPYNKPEVGFRNGDRNFCFSWNLEWMTAEENKQNAIKSGSWNPSAIRHGNRKGVMVQCEETNDIFISKAAAEREYGLSRGCVDYSIMTGKPVKGHTFILHYFYQ